MDKSNAAALEQLVTAAVDDTLSLRDWVRQQAAVLVATAAQVAEAIERGNRILLCGNGGSAGDAQHLATELVVRLSGDFERPALPAIALTTNSSTLTAAANDYGFEQVFTRQLEAFGRPGDVLLTISTSGNSANLVRAVEMAAKRNLHVIQFLGKGGGELEGKGTCYTVPSDDTNRIQEIHIMLGHLLVSLVERILYG